MTDTEEIYYKCELCEENANVICSICEKKLCAKHAKLVGWIDLLFVCRDGHSNEEILKMWVEE